MSKQRIPPKPPPVKNVATVLKNLGITQAELARRMGVKQPRISDWLNKQHRISRIYREKLQQVYDAGMAEKRSGKPPLASL